MAERVDVPALLRYASGAVECHCEERHAGECCKVKVAYLDRLADAVEAWQDDHDEDGDEMHGAPRWRMLALLRGEAPHA